MLKRQWKRNAVVLAVLALTIVGAEEILTPVNILLYDLIWLVPALLVTEWTRSL